MGGEALSPVKGLCPSIGECQDSEVGVSGWEGEHPHRSKGWGGYWGVLEGKLGKGITFET